ncbi:MAG: ATP-binding protein [Nitrososphaerales archaeon]|nr:ATP-binding protein [Nitrososphaerales archaeon]
MVVRAPEGDVLGFVEGSLIRSSLMQAARNYQAAVEAKEAAARNPRDKSNVASVKVLGLMEQLSAGVRFMPSLPPEPGADVNEASERVLTAIFSRDGQDWIRIGRLLRNPDVPVSVNLNRIAARHAAVLAATGSGKSNLLALLAKKVGESNGTMVIFDYQGEYSDLKMRNIVHIQAKVNPKLLDVEKLADMLDIGEAASKQRAMLSSVFTKEVKESSDFWSSLLAQLRSVSKDEDASAEDRRVAERIAEIIERARRRKGRVLDPDIGDPIDQIKPNYVNVLNMIELTEMQAATVISYYLSEILEDRKTARRSRLAREKKVDTRVRFNAPVIVAIEEAHSFLPVDRTTDAKYMASKIAREGRKFGVSLIIVSQRPSRVDQDVLSQMGSLAVSRITQPKDQSYIVESSELVTEELAGYLPSLNVGEVLLLGQWVTLPSMAKVDKVEEKLLGADIDAVSEWREDAKLATVATERTSELIKRK